MILPKRSLVTGGPSRIHLLEDETQKNTLVQLKRHTETTENPNSCRGDPVLPLEVQLSLDVGPFWSM